MKFSILSGLILLLVLNSSCNAPLSASSNTCQVDTDCTVVIDISQCCSCPEVRSRAQVQSDKNLKPYLSGENYGDLLPSSCQDVSCSPCPLPPAGAVCRSGTCQAPQTVEEILTSCPTCFAQAAQATYQAGKLQNAVDLCSKSSMDEMPMCFSELFEKALQKNHLQDAETLCRSSTILDSSDCLRRLAIKWVDQNEPYATALCNELDALDARHFGCLLDIALAVRSKDPERAREICKQLPREEADLCLQEIK
jgi:hypothetical protein